MSEKAVELLKFPLVVSRIQQYSAAPNHWETAAVFLLKNVIPAGMRRKSHTSLKFVIHIAKKLHGVKYLEAFKLQVSWTHSLNATETFTLPRHSLHFRQTYCRSPWTAILEHDLQSVTHKQLFIFLLNYKKMEVLF